MQFESNNRFTVCGYMVTDVTIARPLVKMIFAKLKPNSALD